VPEPQDLVTISQSRCSASDLTRMEAILASKLTNSSQQVPPLPVTPLSFLRAMWEVSRVAAARYTTVFISSMHRFLILKSQKSVLSVQYPDPPSIFFSCNVRYDNCFCKPFGADIPVRHCIVSELKASSNKTAIKASGTLSKIRYRYGICWYGI
jgi:hypothetical protein